MHCMILRIQSRTRTTLFDLIRNRLMHQIECFSLPTQKKKNYISIDDSCREKKTEMIHSTFSLMI